MIRDKILPTLRFCLVEALFWGGFGCVFAFSSVYLLAKGFTNSQVGYVLSAGSAVSVVLQPLVGSYVDRSRKMLLRSLPSALSAAAILTGAVLLLANGFALRAICYGLLVALMQILMPLLYSLGIHYMEKGVSIDFGMGRGTGSTAYAVVTTFLGTVVEKTGEHVVIILLMIILALMIAAILTFRFREADRTAGNAHSGGKAVSGRIAEERDPDNRTDKTGSTSLLAFFAANKRFTAVIAGCVLAFTSHNIITNYLFQIVDFHGYGSREMGYALSITAICEIPALFLLSQIMKKVSVSVLFRTSVLFMFIKNLVLYLATGLAMIYIAMGVQLLGFGLFAGISVYYVNETVAPADRTKGQTLMTATTSAGAVAGCLLGGLLLDGTGVGGMLLVSSVIALCGVIIVGIFAEDRKTAG
ncbi:MAG: MFS transporter [Lachnospiraceae bacterium]|nr:MFS transporter [Lachnospiraceae bacterium]